MYGGKCQGPDICAHGMRLPHHPDYDPSQDGCRQCELESWVDEQFDRLHDEGLAVRDDDDLIYSYTRAQALADGVLVDVSQMASEAGFRYPTAITADLDARLTPNESRAISGPELRRPTVGCAVSGFFRRPKIRASRQRQLRGQSVRS